MTVAELIERLKKMPQEAVVYMAEDNSMATMAAIDHLHVYRPSEYRDPWVYIGFK